MAAKHPLEDAASKVILLQIKEQEADALYLAAKLQREVAEIGINEYESGTFPQEKAKVDGEISLAENDIVRSKESLIDFRELVKKVSKFEASTASETLALWSLKSTLKGGELILTKAELELTSAELSKRVLLEYTHPVRIKQLRFEVELARSNELAKEQDLQYTKDEVRRWKKAADWEQNHPESEWTPILKALDEAVVVEGELRSQLSDGPPAEPAQRVAWNEKLAAQRGRLEGALKSSAQLFDDLTFKRLGRTIRYEGSR